MNKESVEKSIQSIQQKKKELEDSYKKKLAELKDKEKHLNAVLVEAENKEKLKLAAKIPYDELRELYAKHNSIDRSLNKISETKEDNSDEE